MQRGEPRTPAEIRRDGNRLRDEGSLYLRQHAHNPVEWYPWGEEALTRAGDEGKPIFLSIGYASCHWCHVMERETFDDDGVAEYLNQHFVCIKVDREERPDLDAVYMDVVQSMSRSGGWPMSLFLTCGAQPIFGGTYLAREQFLELAARVRDIHARQRAELETQAAACARNLAEAPQRLEAASERGPVDEQLLRAAAVAAGRDFDAQWGGCRGRVKFPVAPRWHFLLHWHRKTGDARALRMVELTLAAMGSGGVYDHIGGGFHRYAVDEGWVVPHFEKMLYDNALLASLYLEAGAALARPEFTAVGRDTLDFLVREMTGTEGGCYASFDADSGAQEGAHYVWDEADLATAAGPRDGAALAALLGVSPAGNFAGGKSVPTRRAEPARVAQLTGRDADEIACLFNARRADLRDFRDRRARPDLDTKIVTAWNGLAISAFADGFAVTGEQAYRIAAERAADWLETTHRRDDGRLWRASTDGRAVGRAVLDDYAALACGLLDLFRVTGDHVRLGRALELIEIARRDFADPAGGFFLTPADTPAPLGRKTELFDGATPCGNAMMLQALLRAASLTGRGDLSADVQRALSRYAGVMERAALEMAWWHDAALRFLGPFYEVVIAGDAQDSLAAVLAATVLRPLPPQVSLVRVPGAGATAPLAALLPQMAGKTAAEGGSLAYVCERGACHEPTADPCVLKERITVGWER